MVRLFGMTPQLRHYIASLFPVTSLRQRGYRWILVVWIMFGMTWIVSIASGFLLEFIDRVLYPGWHLLDRFVLLAVLGSFFGGLGLTFIAIFRMNRVIRIAASNSDKDEISLLIHATSVSLVARWDSPYRSLWMAGKDALIEVLPRLTPADASLLSVRDRDKLNQVLKCGEVRLMLAILEAWKQVGDESALPFVERLAAGKGQAAHIRDLQQAAQECLPCILQRAHLDDSSLLLRAGRRPSSASEELLRPTVGQRETAPQHLLHASDKDGV